MLAKKFRLPAKDLAVINQKNRPAAKSIFFTIKVQKNNLGYGRFGITVSSKVSKSAVVRNKIKRVIFNYIRHQDLHLRSTGRDVLIKTLPPAVSLDKGPLQKEINQLLLPIFKNK